MVEQAEIIVLAAADQAVRLQEPEVMELRVQYLIQQFLQQHLPLAGVRGGMVEIM